MMARLRRMSARGKRRVVQVIAAVLYNANVGNFLKGTISRGEVKKVCVPGLNCYSCPGSVAACPLGALQASLSSFPTAIPLYMLGILLIFGALLGRAICAFLCPFGLIQELLHKFPHPSAKECLDAPPDGYQIHSAGGNGRGSASILPGCQRRSDTGVLQVDLSCGDAGGRCAAAAGRRKPARAGGLAVFLEGAAPGGDAGGVGVYLSSLLPVCLSPGGDLLVFQSRGAVWRARG